MNWLRRIMAGRYGTDQLCWALLIGSLFFIAIGRFSRWGIFFLIAFTLLVICYYRMFSRNIQKRYLENVRFVRKIEPIRKKFWALSQRIKTSKTHRHFKCPRCGQKLRVPKGRGKIEITCPKCGERFEKRT